MVNRDQKVNQMSTFFTLAQQQLDPNSIDTILKQIWELMGFDSKDIRAAGLNPQPAAGGGAPTPGPGGAAPGVLPTPGAPVPGAPTPGGPPAPTAVAGKAILAQHIATGNGGSPTAPAANSIVPQLRSPVGHTNLPGGPTMPAGMP
jgi:hypothetical protein